MTAIGQYNHEATSKKGIRNSRCLRATVDNGRRIPDATEGSKMPFEDQCVIRSFTARSLNKPYKHLCSLLEMFHDTTFRLQTMFTHTRKNIVVHTGKNHTPNFQDHEIRFKIQLHHHYATDISKNKIGTSFHNHEYLMITVTSRLHTEDIHQRKNESEM